MALARPVLCLRTICSPRTFHSIQTLLKEPKQLDVDEVRLSQSLDPIAYQHEEFVSTTEEPEPQPFHRSLHDVDRSETLLSEEEKSHIAFRRQGSNLAFQRAESPPDAPGPKLSFISHNFSGQKDLMPTGVRKVSIFKSSVDSGQKPMVRKEFRGKDSPKQAQSEHNLAQTSPESFEGFQGARKLLIDGDFGQNQSLQLSLRYTSRRPGNIRSRESSSIISAKTPDVQARSQAQAALETEKDILRDKPRITRRKPQRMLEQTVYPPSRFGRTGLGRLGDESQQPQSRLYHTFCTTRCYSTQPSAALQPETGTQPTESVEQLTYFVERSQSGNLPVYSDYKGHGTLIQTVIRKISGNAKQLKEDLVENLELEPKNAKVTQPAGHVVIKGAYNQKVMEFLKSRGF